MGVEHLPVMAGEVVGLLRPREGGVYIDATVGLGGHALELLGHIGPRGRLLCLDRDPEALALAGQRLSDRRCIMRRSRFSAMQDAARAEGLSSVDGVLMDLGVSMLQLKGAGRGFSFHSDEPLDMRMDPSGALTAEEMVNDWPMAELDRVLLEYGEEWNHRKITKALDAARRRGRIRTCRELAEVVGSAVPRRGRAHPATKTFQALRIAVNDELGELKAGLGAALGLLGPGGRMAVIAYHSLEDREVKQFMRRARTEGRMEIITKKPLRPAREEVLRNPSARSARLRVGEAI